MKTKEIDKVGIEIEGSWKNKPKGSKIYHDGSVNLGGPENLKGEVHSRPLKNLDKLKTFIENNYPDRVNYTCGLHIHVSPKNLKDINSFGRRKFFNDFGKFLKSFIVKYKLGKTSLRKRVNGGNAYCGKKFLPKRQLENEGTRYTQLNFKSFRSHGTIENRVFPAFKDKNIAYLACKEYVEFIEKWISENRNSKGGLGLSVQKLRSIRG